MFAEEAWQFAPKRGEPGYEAALAYMASVNQAADAYIFQSLPEDSPCKVQKTTSTTTDLKTTPK